MFLFSFRSYFVVFFLLFLSLQGYGQTTYTVTTADNGGVGSLREAISSSNITVGTSNNTIIFGITNATIQLSSPLPAITKAVIIDGIGKDIIIDGSGIPQPTSDANGFVFVAGSAGSKLMGITVSNFIGICVYLNAVSNIEILDNVLINSNYGIYGQTNTDIVVSGNRIGISKNNLCSGNRYTNSFFNNSNLVIGKKTATDSYKGNIISCGAVNESVQDHLRISTSTDVTIKGNKFGTDDSATFDYHALWRDINTSAITRLVVGGTDIREQNIFTAYYGLEFENTTTGSFIGNKVGVLGNNTVVNPLITNVNHYGLSISFASNFVITNNTIIGHSCNIEIFGSTGIIIENNKLNYIDDTHLFPNSISFCNIKLPGVYYRGSSQYDAIVRNNIMGGTEYASIYNGYDGVSNKIFNNHIGISPSGVNLNNKGYGIVTVYKPFGELEIKNNTIAYNPLGGISLASDKNLISRNLIYGNGSSKAINLNLSSSTPGNSGKPAPILSNLTVLNNVYSVTITAQAGDEIELFAGDGTQNAKRYLQTVNMGANTTKIVTLGMFNTGETHFLATATDVQNNTSELGSITACSTSLPSPFVFSANSSCPTGFKLTGTVYASCPVALTAQLSANFATSTPIVIGSSAPTTYMANTVASIDVTPPNNLTPGVYYIRVVSSDGVISPQQAITIGVPPIQPTISIAPTVTNTGTPSCGGQVFTFSTQYSNLSNTNYLHVWTLTAGGITTTYNTPTINYTANDNNLIIVTVAVSDGVSFCQSQLQTQNVIPSILPVPTLTNTTFTNPSCASTANANTGSINNNLTISSSITNAVATLYQNGAPINTLPVVNNCTVGNCNIPLSFENLSAGSYEVVISYGNGCQVRSTAINLATTAPIVTACTSPLSCNANNTTDGTISITASYPSAPTLFANKFAYKIFRGDITGPLVIAGGTINNNNPSTITIPFASIVPNQILVIQIIPLLNCVTTGCTQLVEDICYITQNVRFMQPVLSMTLPATPLGGDVPVYEVCQFPFEFPVSVSSSVVACDNPFSYNWTLSKNGQNYPTNQNGLLSIPVSGIYTITATENALGCTISRTFEIKEIAVPVLFINTVNVLCKKLGRADAVLSGYLGIVNYIWQKKDGVGNWTNVLFPRNGGTVVRGENITDLEVGEYQCVMTITTFSGTCEFKQPFVILEGPKIVEPQILISNTDPITGLLTCNPKATAQVIFPTGMPVQGNLPYGVSWYYVVPLRNPDGTVQRDATNNIIFEEREVFNHTVNSTITTTTIAGTTDIASNLPAENFEASIYPNDARLRGTYYVIITDNQGCTYRSTNQELIKPNAERTFVLCLTWEDAPVIPTPVEEPVVADAEILASEAIADLTDKVEACKKRNQQLASVVAPDLVDSLLTDELTFRYNQKTHHYTLYYYDRAGRLTKTVPPEGVSPLKIGDKDAQNETISEISRAYVPAHTMPTTYEYNSLGQLVSQNTPDGGTSNFIYDNKGQLRFSQNAKQLADARPATAIPPTYSYTIYDQLGRITEVGQTSALHTNNAPLFGYDVANPNSIKSANEVLFDMNAVPAPPIAQFYFPQGNVANEQITKTFYTDAVDGVYYFEASKTQRNLQNRVSYTYALNKGDKDLSRAVHTYYSYDVHGNVEWMVQDVPGFGRSYMAYEYDLISGKVLKVSYNENRKDKFFHRYDYDEDNRLTKVETSKDGLIWDADAIYDYYKHGPLKRVGLGEGQIQGLDYVYTIHGWLKGINSPVSGQADDIGLDGVAGTNVNVAKDAFGMSLGYYQGDYRSSNTGIANGSSAFSNTNQTPPVPLLPANRFSLEEVQPASDLYNGNISSWATSMSYYTPVVGTTPAIWANKSFGSRFRYDQLNRIKSSNEFAYNNNNAKWESEGRKLETNYTYDANGNLDKLTRNDDLGKPMDELDYTYQKNANGKKINNKLQKVKDGIDATMPNSSTYDKDIEGINNYEYDAIGNLTKDVKENIEIDWTAYGKVNTVKPLYDPRLALDAAVNKKPQLRYIYDASGNRIAKIAQKLYKFDGSDPVFREEDTKTTYYVRDAQGNVMSVYERTNEKKSSVYEASYKQAEISLYGSDRLGTYRPENIQTKAIYDPNSVQQTENADYLEVILQTENTSLITPTTQNGTFGISQINNTTNNALPALQTLIVGAASDNVAMGETIEGTLEIYSIVAKDYFGAKNVCLVYDKDGFLLPNSDGIFSDTLTKNLIVRHPTKANTYFLFSRSKDGELCRTTITKVNENYEVIAKNKIIPTNGAIGAHFTAIEDQNQNQILLYATRGNLVDKKAELIVIALTDNAPSAPILLASLDYPETDAYKGGELQISPDGKELLWYHLGERLAWFDVQEMKPTTFLLGLGGTTVTQIQIPLGSNVVGFTQTAYASIDIDKNNNLSFTQKTLQNVENVYKNGILPPANIAGDVRRGKDDVILGLVVQGLVRPFGFGLPVQVHTRTNKLSSQPAQVYVSRLLRVRSFELKDHLGNVRVMVEDQKNENKTAKIQSYSNYYAFGMEMPGLQYAEGKDYRYGFNGKENDKDFGTAGLTQDYGFRLYNPAIAKFLSVDPLAPKYPELTPYQFASNMPVRYIDLDGLENSDPMYYIWQGFGDGFIGMGDWISNIFTSENTVTASTPLKTFRKGSSSVEVGVEFKTTTESFFQLGDILRAAKQANKPIGSNELPPLSRSETKHTLSTYEEIKVSTPAGVLSTKRTMTPGEETKVDVGVEFKVKKVIPVKVSGSTSSKGNNKLEGSVADPTGTLKAKTSATVNTGSTGGMPSIKLTLGGEVKAPDGTKMSYEKSIKIKPRW